MSASESLPRSNAFVWNASGWFGGQFGGTFWMLLAGLFMLRIDATTGWITIAAYAALNVLGLVLWSRRREMKPYPAFQILIGATGLVAIGLFVLWQRLGRDRIQEAFGGQAGYVHYAWLLVFPVLMLMFWLQERRGRA